MRFYLLAAFVPLIAATAIPAGSHHELDERNNGGQVAKPPKIDFDSWDPYNTTMCTKKQVKKCSKEKDKKTCSTSSVSVG